MFCFRLHSLSRVIRALPWERVALSRRLPYFKPGRERRLLKGSRVQVRAEYVYLPPPLLLLGHPCPPPSLTNVPRTTAKFFDRPLSLSLVFFFSFSSSLMLAFVDRVSLPSRLDNYISKIHFSTCCC